MNEEIGTLAINEFHPAAHSALAYVIKNGFKYVECFASASLSGNRLAEICSETLRRLLNNETVSDRYLLGLAWTIKDIKRLNKPIKLKKLKTSYLKAIEHEKPEFILKTCKHHGVLPPEKIRIYNHKGLWTPYCLICRQIQWDKKNVADKIKRKKLNPPVIKEISEIVNKLGKTKE